MRFHRAEWAERKICPLSRDPEQTMASTDPGTGS